MDDVVILAGGQNPADLAALSGVPDRSSIPFQGQTLLQIAHQAVLPLCEPLVVGGPSESSPRCVPGGNSFIESLEIALDNTQADRFLLVFADMPFLTSEAVNHFIRLADPQADVNYPVVPADLCAEAYPGLSRTSLRLKEGLLTGGNVALLKTAAVREALPLVKSLYDRRKSPLRLAQALGPRTFALLLKAKANPQKVSIQDFEALLGRLLNLKVNGVLTPEPSIGTDIDNAQQYQILLNLTKNENVPTT